MPKRAPYPFSPSESLVDWLKRTEELRLIAYLDSKGVPTIGYGHTRGVRLGDVCTAEQADDWLLEDLRAAVSEVNRLCGALPLVQGQVDCLISFEFNTGGLEIGSPPHPSRVLAALLDRRWFDAGEEILHWNWSGGDEIYGLFNRRIDELDFYRSDRWIE